MGKGVKHNFVINARPILRWNTTEVFLYLFRYNLPINGAYRVGKPRVGCVLCPFGSPWDDMIVNRCYHDKLHPFISRIEEIVDSRNIPNKEEYIADRRWKLRSSGKFTHDETVIKITTSTHKWEAKVKNSKKVFLIGCLQSVDIVLRTQVIPSLENCNFVVKYINSTSSMRHQKRFYIHSL